MMRRAMIRTIILQTIIAALFLGSTLLGLASHKGHVLADQLGQQATPNLRTTGEPFADGETVCFLGDSITAGGYVQTIVADYYATRFPNRNITFVNAGRSGDTASGSLKRLQEDVIDKHPTTVIINFGMNDVNRGAYVDNPSESKLATQQQALDRYQAKMEELVARIRQEANEPKLYFMTPSPFDDKVVLDRDNNQPGCNDGLGRCGDILRELAKKNNAVLVDLHGPMTKLNQQQQKLDPTWTIVGSDRIHPGDPGRLMMAWLFLKSQGVPSLISKTVIDAASGKARETVNVDVSSITTTNRGVTFTTRENALPMPINSGPAAVLKLLPIEDELLQQTLTVTGLINGVYDLRIDGTSVGQYPATELKSGINLALNKTTPQSKQARIVVNLNAERRSAEAQACSLLNTRRWMQNYYKVDVEDPAAVQKHYDHFEDKTQYSAGMAKRYMRDWPLYGDFRKQVLELEQAVIKACQLKPHTYELVRTSPVASTKGTATGNQSVVENMPGLVGFWIFGEAPGQPRFSVGTEASLPLTEVGGSIPRDSVGPYSGFSAKLNGKHYFKIPYAETGKLNISGPEAQVSMFSVVRVVNLHHSRTIAGMWSEGKGIHDDSGTRQYGLLMNMPAYGGPRQLVPHISSEGGVTQRADGSRFPWCADYAASVSEVPEETWCTLGFTYDSDYIRAYVNGVMEPRALDPVKDRRNDRYFTQEGPDGGDRGMNPYYHGRGIFRYDPSKHADTKPDGGADFTVGARYAVGSYTRESTIGHFGGLAVFDRALSDAEMKQLHDSANVDALNQDEGL